MRDGAQSKLLSLIRTPVDVTVTVFEVGGNSTWSGTLLVRTLLTFWPRRTDAGHSALGRPSAPTEFGFLASTVMPAPSSVASTLGSSRTMPPVISWFGRASIWEFGTWLPATVSTPNRLVDQRTPGLQLLRRVLGRVDDDRRRADALQADRLPHHDELGVIARVDHDQVARPGRVDRVLDRVRVAGRGRHVECRFDHHRRRTADRHRDGVDRLLLIGGDDHQLARSDAGRHRRGDGRVAPAGHRQRRAVDRDQCPARRRSRSGA